MPFYSFGRLDARRDQIEFVCLFPRRTAAIRSESELYERNDQRLKAAVSRIPMLSAMIHTNLIDTRQNCA